MTIIELMVAVLVLAIGILGMVSMIDTSNATTAKNKSREGATNLGRGIMEIARGISYRDLNAAQLVATLQARTGLNDASPAAGYQISSRDHVYTLSASVCSLDDAKDGLGEHDAAADPPYCTDTATLGAGQTARDRNPDDYRRVRLSFAWESTGSDFTTTQTGHITNPVGGLGPSLVALNPVAPATTNITTPLASASFSVTTSVNARNVDWSLNGSKKGTAGGSGRDWSFSWQLDATRADGSLVYPDCTYVLEAEAFDNLDRSGSSKALTVNVNRLEVVETTGLEGGRNLNGSRVDLQWHKNRECDIRGYRVFRGTDKSNINTLVCSTTPNDTDCVDESAPAPAAGQTLYYQVAGVDTHPDTGGERVSTTPSAILTIAEANTAPTAPPTVSACAGGNPGCTDIDGNASFAGTNAISWSPSTDPEGIYFYRIYRGGATYANRYDVLFPVAGKPLVYIDPDPAAGANSYYVSAVDPFFGESVLTGPATVSP